jgi:hypothetical protein
MWTRILCGTKPADMPIEQPINQTTAKALGLTIPEFVPVEH